MRAVDLNMGVTGRNKLTDNPNLVDYRKIIKFVTDELIVSLSKKSSLVIKIKKVTRNCI